PHIRTVTDSQLDDRVTVHVSDFSDLGFPLPIHIHPDTFTGGKLYFLVLTGLNNIGRKIPAVLKHVSPPFKRPAKTSKSPTTLRPYESPRGSAKSGAHPSPHGYAQSVACLRIPLSNGYDQGRTRKAACPTSSP